MRVDLKLSEAQGKCELKLILNGMHVIHLVLVAAYLAQDYLLGIESFCERSCKIDFERKAANIGKNVVGLDGNNNVQRF